MDVKNRAKAERMKANLKNGSGSTFVKVKECPFCGSGVLTSLSHKGIRFFDCTGCGLKASFQASEEESLNLWESRIGECETQDEEEEKR